MEKEILRMQEPTALWSLIILDTEDLKGFSHYDELLTYDTGTLVVWQKGHIKGG